MRRAGDHCRRCRSRPPSTVRWPRSRMLSGFYARWMTPCPCAYASAPATSRQHAGRFDGANGRRRTHASATFPLDVRHAKNKNSPIFDSVDGDDVWMGQFRRRARFAQEPLPQLGVRRLRGRQQLDGDGTVEAHFARQVHHAHPAPAQLPFQRVAARDGGLEVEEQAIRRAGLAHASMIGPAWTPAPF